MDVPVQHETRRRRLMRYFLVFLIVGGTGAVLVQREFLGEGDGSVAAGQALEIGRPAPDFTLETADGTFRLSEARGRVVMINFWATWCGPCRFEMPEFQEVHEARLDAGDLQIVAVNLTASDSREGALRFVDELGLTFTIAFDVTGGVAQAYGVLGLPATFFIDRDGILRARTYGPVLGDRLAESIAAAGG
jgi:cytochrome c biogenesis protein CcmG, thiol:disulfide interchange protein DsbE